MKNMANKIINVLIVDDEQIVREGLRYIIDWNTLGFCICGEAANGEDALEMIRQYRPGLVLLDIRMSGMLGTELMEKARSEGFSGAFIILSGYSDFKYAQTALQFGASYYLTKPIDEDELEKAVQDVHEKIEFQLNSETSRNQYLKKAKVTTAKQALEYKHPFMFTSGFWHKIKPNGSFTAKAISIFLNTAFERPKELSTAFKENTIELNIAVTEAIFKNSPRIIVREFVLP